MLGWDAFVKAYHQGHRIKTFDQASEVEREILSFLVEIRDAVEDLRDTLSGVRHDLSDVIRIREK